jgi:hypothetical protein
MGLPLLSHISSIMLGLKGYTFVFGSTLRLRGGGGGGGCGKNQDAILLNNRIDLFLP